MLSATFRGDERLLVPACTLQLKTEKAKQGMAKCGMYHLSSLGTRLSTETKSLSHCNISYKWFLEASKDGSSSIYCNYSR